MTIYLYHVCPLQLPPGVALADVAPAPAPGPGPAVAPMGAFITPTAAPSAESAPSNLVPRKMLSIVGQLLGKRTTAKPVDVYGSPYPYSDPVIPSNDPDFPSELVHRPLDPANYTLSRAGRDYRVTDIQQYRLGNCWHLAPLMSHLRNGGVVDIRDVSKGGSFDRFIVTFRVGRRTARVHIDNYVLFLDERPYTHVPAYDSNSGKYIAWPMLWVKAYTQLAAKYETVVSPDVREGYADVEGGIPFRAIYPITGRLGTPLYMDSPATTGTPSVRDVLRQVLQGQGSICVGSTRPSEGEYSIESMLGYDIATRTVNSSGDIWQLQSLDQDRRGYSVRHLPTDFTFVLPYGHAMPLTKYEDTNVHFDIGNPWGHNIVLHDFGGTEMTPYGNPYIRGIPGAAITFAFYRISYG